MYKMKTSANFYVNGGETDHDKLNNLDYEHSGHTGFQPAGNYIEDNNYVHTDNNYTTEEKTKLAGLSNYDDTQIVADISDLEDTKADKSEIPDVSDFITKDVDDLSYYTLAVDTGHSIELTLNSSTYVLTLSLKNSEGTVLNTNTVDLPLETMVVDGDYDSTNKKIVLTLQSGSTIDVPVGDLVSGLQTEITSNNKLSADLVDDSLSANKFVSVSDKTTWSGKQDALVSGTNIKTINNQSILGSGDITIGGGDSDLGKVYVWRGQSLESYTDTKLAKIYKQMRDDYVNGINSNLVFCTDYDGYNNTSLYNTVYRVQNYNSTNKILTLNSEMISLQYSSGSSGGYSQLYLCSPTVQITFNNDDEITRAYTSPNRYNSLKYLDVNGYQGYGDVAFIPTRPGAPASKKYVDDSIASAIGTALGGSY